MPEVTRVILVGFDPMLVRGYVKTNARALWFYLPDELYKELKIKPETKVKGRLLKIYGPDGKVTATPDEPFEWPTSKESGLAVVVPSSDITKYALTCFHFLEMRLEKVGDTAVHPGKELARKMWPEGQMKLAYSTKYMAP
ncbi:MAG: hypothetical protein WAN74_06275 [Thermoplasmata archaeon]